MYDSLLSNPPPKIRDVKKMKLAVVIALASAAHALRPTMDRRAMLGAVSSGVVVGTAQAASAAAVKPCTAGANNCWSTASTDKNAMKPWAFPKGAKKSDAISQLQEVVGAYPQAGQADVDISAEKPPARGESCVFCGLLHFLTASSIAILPTYASVGVCAAWFLWRV